MNSASGQHFNHLEEDRLAHQEHNVLAILKWLAMILLIVDHVSLCMGNFIPGRIVGRLAFPLFAYLIVVGMRYTSSQGRYLKRILIFALISELPYNLMLNLSIVSSPKDLASILIYPAQQNILFTFALAMAAIIAIRRVGYDDKTKTYHPHAPLATTLITAGAALIGQLLRVDYGGIAVAAIVVAHTTMYGVGYDRIRVRFGQITLVICLAFLQPIGSYLDMVATLGFFVPFSSIQFFAVCALPLIMLSMGVRAAYSSREKRLNKLFYLVYPVHMVILVGYMLVFRGF